MRYGASREGILVLLSDSKSVMEVIVAMECDSFLKEMLAQGFSDCKSARKRETRKKWLEIRAYACLMSRYNEKCEKTLQRKKRRFM